MYVCMYAMVGVCACLTDMSAAGRCLANDVSRDIANCAVLTVLPPGVFITMMPGAKLAYEEIKELQSCCVTFKGPLRITVNVCDIVTCIYSELNMICRYGNQI